MDIEGIIKILCNGKSDAEIEDFLLFHTEKLWNEYKNHLMEKILIVENLVKDLPIVIPNASVKKGYDNVIAISCENLTDLKLEGLTEEHGLTIEPQKDGKSFRIFGTPTQSGTFELSLKYGYKGLEVTDRPYLERKLQIIINPDPRDLWKDLPVPEDIEFPKENTAMEYVKVESLPDGTPQKDIVAASKRGRSHAQEGKPRDDHFKLYHSEESNWYVIAVADGAGSAKYSREGSRIACDVAVSHCVEQLSDCTSFEDNINLWHLDQASQEAGKAISADIYKIVGNAAYKAHKAIADKAAEHNDRSKDYATTLLLAICKKFEFGWFIASFWVGDGAMCIFNEEEGTSVLLGTPDEGDYAGQTRFLTMSDIFSDTASFYNRLKCRIVPDFTALFLMSDGVSDPKFETDANLNNPEKWKELWENLKSDEEHPVDLSDDNEESAQQLLDWLDFWSPGNHDDRTIAILY